MDYPTDGDPSEGNLVERARAGDESAFRALFDGNVPAIEARVRRRLAPSLLRKVSVSDVVQETRIVAFRKCAAFDDRGEGAFGAWLLGIAEYEVRRVRRRYGGTAKRAAGREVSRDARGATAGFADRGPSPSEAAATREARDDVRRALETLSEDHAEILRLTQLKGLTLGEAAERMGRSREAAKKLYGRALVRLTGALAARGRGAP